MDITLEMIPKIEKALDIKLYDSQIEDLINNNNTYCGRRSGKTTIYMVKLALSEGEPLIIHDFRLWTDRSSNETHYTDWFERQFMMIRQNLNDVGFKVRDVLYGKKKI